MHGECENIVAPGEQIGISEYPVAVENERVKQSVEAFSDRSIQHEFDRVVFTDRVIVVRHRKLNQLHAAAKLYTTRQLIITWRLRYLLIANVYTQRLLVSCRKYRFCYNY